MYGPTTLWFSQDIDNHPYCENERNYDGVSYANSLSFKDVVHIAGDLESPLKVNGKTFLI